MAQQTVHLFVLDGMADWEIGYAVAGINQPTFQLEPGRYRVGTVGPTREPIRTMGGLTIVPDQALQELEPRGSAMLILPGAVSWAEGEHAAAAERAREFLDAGVAVAAICGATVGLAREGLLNDRPHTSNSPGELAGAPGYTGHARYVSQPAVRDGDLITATGTAPVDFAKLIFERLGLYAPPVLEAWYALYAQGDPSPFLALQAAMSDT